VPGGRQGGGVGVVLHGVHSQKGETFAVAAIHPDFHTIHALLGPADGHLSGIERGGEDGFHRAHIHSLVCADQLQSPPDGIGVDGRDFDAGGERGGAAKNAERDRGAE
jgi:hypothetical protein